MRTARLLALALLFAIAARADSSLPDRGGAGHRCLTGAQCASGICEGQGCDDRSPGRCAPVGRGCPRNHAPFCGCDGTTFYQSSACPGRRFRHLGECSRSDGQLRANPAAGSR